MLRRAAAMSNTKLTLLVAGLVLIGLLTGVAVGSDDESPVEARTVTVARTVVSTTTDTVTRTETVTHTRVKVKYKTRVKVKYRTVTEPAPDYGGDPGSSDAGCSDEYEGACVPADAYDVDCGELADSDFDSVGSDPYGLDADGDGVACES
jgi:hypothetical protein